MDGNGWDVGVPPIGIGDGGVGTTGDGDLHLPPPEHVFTVYCVQANYGPVSSGGETPGDKGVKSVVVVGGPVLGGDADVGSGGGMGGEGGGRGRGIYIDRYGVLGGRIL